MADGKCRLLGWAVAGLVYLSLQSGIVFADAKSLIFILDASGSMWSQIGGRNKIAIAREALGGLIRDLPDATDTALIAYGHRRKGDCADIETLTALGPIDKPGLTANINRLNPMGMTPLADALKAALAQLRGGDPTIVLISDGLDSCGGDPCGVVSAAKAAGTGFRLHVIGFAIRENDVSQLECVAQTGGGLYFDVRSADELSRALALAVRQPVPAETGRLSITTLTNDRLSDTAITIARAGESTPVAAGRTYTGAQTNPRLFTLPAGDYDVTLRALGFDGDTQRRFEGVVIPEGELLARVVEFSTGRLSISVVVNDRPGDALVRVTRSGDGSPVAERRSAASSQRNPVLFELTAGSYDLSVTPVNARAGAQKRLAGIDVTQGANVDRAVVFGTGTLSVGVTRNGIPGDARIEIFESGGTKPVARGRTDDNAGGNPRQFVLPSGSYDIAIESLEISGGAPQRLENIVLEPKSLLERSHNFDSGSLAVAALFEGKPVDARFSVVSVETGGEVGGGRTAAAGRALVLPPGRYRIAARGVKLKGDPRAEIDVDLSAGQVLEQRIELKPAN